MFLFLKPESYKVRTTEVKSCSVTEGGKKTQAWWEECYNTGHSTCPWAVYTATQRSPARPRTKLGSLWTLLAGSGCWPRQGGHRVSEPHWGTSSPSVLLRCGSWGTQPAAPNESPPSDPVKDWCLQTLSEGPGCLQPKALLQASNHKTPCPAGRRPKARLIPYVESSTTHSHVSELLLLC